MESEYTKNTKLGVHIGVHHSGKGVHIGVHHSGKGIHIGVYKPSHYIAIGSNINTIINL